MPKSQDAPNIPLPKTWTEQVRSAVLHVQSLAQYAAVDTRARAADSVNARVRLKAENDQLTQAITQAVADATQRFQGTGAHGAAPTQSASTLPKQRESHLEPDIPEERRLFPYSTLREVVASFPGSNQKSLGRYTSQSRRCRRRKSGDVVVNRFRPARNTRFRPVCEQS